MYQIYNQIRNCSLYDVIVFDYIFDLTKRQLYCFRVLSVWSAHAVSSKVCSTSTNFCHLPSPLRIINNRHEHLIKERIQQSQLPSKASILQVWDLGPYFWKKTHTNFSVSGFGFTTDPIFFRGSLFSWHIAWGTRKEKHGEKSSRKALGRKGLKVSRYPRGIFREPLRPGLIGSRTL